MFGGQHTHLAVACARGGRPRLYSGSWVWPSHRSAVALEEVGSSINEAFRKRFANLHVIPIRYTWRT